MLTRGQKIAVAIILGINVGIAVAAWMLLVGPMRFVGSIVIAAEVGILCMAYLRYARNPMRYLTPIPPRQGASRSGAPMVEAFYRVREDLNRRFAK